MRWIILLMASLLAACEDRGACLASHKEQTTTVGPIMMGMTPCGNGCMMPNYIYLTTVLTVDVCDKWEKDDGKLN